MNMKMTTLTEIEKAALVKRNSQLFDLIAMDPRNREVYEGELIENNIRLVPMVLKKFGQYNEDQFQTGCIGLIMAAKTFDTSKNVPFASYAAFLINRELQATFKVSQGWFENRNAGNMVSLDTTLDMGEGTVTIAETIADDIAEFDFVKCMNDFQLAELFEEIIDPILDAYVLKRKAGTNYDSQKWRNLEMALILDLIEMDVTSQVLTFTKMASLIGVSTQFVKSRHTSVLEKIKEKVISTNYMSRWEVR